MKLNKIITMAALSAAFLVTPACNSGGGGGGGGDKTNDGSTTEGSTTPGTSSQGYAPEGIKALSWTNKNGATYNFSMSSSGSVSCKMTYIQVSGYSFWDGTYTYTKLSDNTASLELEVKSSTGSSSTFRQKFTLTFVSPNEADAYIYHWASTGTNTHNLRIPVTPR